MIYNACALEKVKFDSIVFDLNLVIKLNLTSQLRLAAQLSLATQLSCLFGKYCYPQQLYGKTANLNHIQLALFLR